MTVTVIGGMNMDLLGVPEGTLLFRDSNPGKILMRPGGVGRNIASRLKALGAQVQLLTALGSGRQAELLASSCKGEGIGLKVIAPDAKVSLNFSVRRYNDTVMTAAHRWKDLTPDPYYTVSIDHLVAPLGTATCGPGVAERYTISGDSSYCYSFIFMPGHHTIDEITSTAAAHFKPHTAITDMPEIAGKRLPVRTLTCNKTPAGKYSDGFPQVLADGRRAVPGDYRHGWAGFEAPDTVEMTLTLEEYADLGELSVGVCHSPGDWVVKPLDVQASWSIDGQKWSDWQSLELLAQPSNLYTDSRRLTYLLEPRKARQVHYFRLRFICRPQLPIWHPSAGHPAWLMLDEIEVKKK